MLLTIVLLLGFSLVEQSLQAQSWVNAGRLGGSNPEGGQNILAGPDGTFYVAGKFQTVTNIGGVVLNAQNGNETFLAKLDSSGTVLWVKGILGDALRETVRGMDIDAAGNLYIVGDFESYVEFDSVYLASTYFGARSSYMARVSPTGNLDWFREVGATSDMVLTGMEVDDAGRLVLSGQYADTLIIQGDTVFSNGGTDIFVAGFDTLSNHVWTKSFGGPGFDFAWAFGANDAGNFAVSGVVTDTTTIDSTQFGIMGIEELFIVRMDTAANVDLLIVEPDVTTQFELFDIDLNDDNEIAIGGNFVDTLKMGGAQRPSFGSKDIGIAVYTNTGSLKWIESGGGTDLDELKGLEYDRLGNLYITGYMIGNTTIAGTSLNSSTIVGDYYAMRLSPTGAVEWAENTGLGFFDYASGFDMDLYDGLLFITGEFTSTVTFGGAFPLSSAGTSDLFWGVVCQDASVDLATHQVGPFCIGQNFDVDYEVFGCYESGNTFTVELSDEFGSFATPYNIGSASSVISGTIGVSLPNTLPSGTGYRFRILSDMPADTSADNGIDFTVESGTAINISSATGSNLCDGTTINLDAGTGFWAYAWSTGAASQVIPVNLPGTYSIAVIDSAGCISRDTFIVNGPYPFPTKPALSPANGTTICSNGTIQLNGGAGYHSYLWAHGDTTQFSIVNQPGFYSLVVTSEFGCSTASDTMELVPPVPPTVNRLGDSLQSSAAISYQWYLGPSLIVGATNQIYVPFQSGPYSVQVVDFDGCTERSDSVDFIIGVTPIESDPFISVYPVPANASLVIETARFTLEGLKIQLTDLTGKVLLEKTGEATPSTTLDVSQFSNGTYLLRITRGEVLSNHKIILSR